MLNLTITVPVCLKSIGDPQKHLKPTLLTQLAIMPIQSHRTEKKTNYISLISHMVLLDNNEIERTANGYFCLSLQLLRVY